FGMPDLENAADVFLPTRKAQPGLRQCGPGAKKAVGLDAHPALPSCAACFTRPSAPPAIQAAGEALGQQLRLIQARLQRATVAEGVTRSDTIGKPQREHAAPAHGPRLSQQSGHTPDQFASLSSRRHSRQELGNATARRLSASSLRTEWETDPRRVPNWEMNRRATLASLGQRSPCSSFSWHSMQWRAQGTASRRLPWTSSWQDAQSP